MYQDFKDRLSAFHARGVRYLVVGGYAVSFHGHPRATKDLDLFVKADPADAEATYAALASLALRLMRLRRRIQCLQDLLCDWGANRRRLRGYEHNEASYGDH